MTTIQSHCLIYDKIFVFVSYFFDHRLFQCILGHTDTFHLRTFHGRTLDCNPLQKNPCIHKRIAVAIGEIEGETLILIDKVFLVQPRIKFCIYAFWCFSRLYIVIVGLLISISPII